MKASEEIYLKDLIRKFNKCLNESNKISYFYDNDLDIKNTSLQELSFKSDINFFDEVGFILSVITSIISHPHLLNKGEEVVIRSELAPELTRDMFLKTIKDSKLWRQDGLDMVPENVYYYQQIDELRIYENIFIVNLIKKLSHEIDKYKEFYVKTIGSYLDNNLSMKKDNVDVALKKMSYLERKIKHIKDTYFFKVINKGSTKLGRVTPTNILIKDRLYNYCYKFYKKLITYNDRFKFITDIRLYYYLKLLKALKLRGFKLIEDGHFETIDGVLAIPYIKLENEDFIIEIDEDYDNLGLILIVLNKHIKNKKINTSNNLLIFDDHSIINEISVKNKDDFDSIHTITLWNLADISVNNSDVFSSIRSEDELILEYLDSKILVRDGSSDIYTRYCPVCRSSLIDSNDDGVYRCEECRSRYVFYKNKENINDSLWLIRLRRDGYGR